MLYANVFNVWLGLRDRFILFIYAIHHPLLEIELYRFSHRSNKIQHARGDTSQAVQLIFAQRKRYN